MICDADSCVLALPEAAWHVKKPALYIAATRDHVSFPALAKKTMEQYLPHAELKELDAGHWPQFEATEELNGMLVEWLERVSVT